MGALLKKLVVKFVKAKWGEILPALFRAAAEGQFGDKVKFCYWKVAGAKTITGAILLGAGAGLETIGASYNLPELAPWAKGIYALGAFLTSVGLVDGGTRSPWPDGTPKDKE